MLACSYLSYDFRGGLMLTLGVTFLLRGLCAIGVQLNSVPLFLPSLLIRIISIYLSAILNLIGGKYSFIFAAGYGGGVKIF